MSVPASPAAQLRIDLAGWLNDFALPDRTRGRDYYSRGRVLELEITVEPGVTSAFATVQGGDDYQCTLTHSPDAGWDGECTCPVGVACKHLFAAGTSLLDRLTAETLRPLDAPLAPEAPAAKPDATAPDEDALIAQFTAATGAPPERKPLAFLRNLLALHRSLHASHHPDFRSLQALLPAAHRAVTFPYYSNPFDGRWSHPPATPLELWSHVALLLTERNVPLPAFMAKLTDLAWARAAIAAHHGARELARWRARFAALENTVEPPGEAAAPPSLRSLRLRLGPKNNVWELSRPRDAAPATGPAASPPPEYSPVTATDLRHLLDSAEQAALVLEPASASFAALLRARQNTRGRLNLRLADSADREFLGRLLGHPLARTCVVDEDGRPLTRDARRLVWRFRDHPEDPGLTLAQLAFPDGTPAPEPLLHLPGTPDLYLHGATVFAGLPPPGSNSADVAAAVPVPRAALALPEAARFAARARLTLPGDTAGRFRTETLRPRLRALLEPRRPGGDAGDDVLVVELAAVAPDGTPRAIYEHGTWRRTGPGLPPPPPAAAFLLLDFDGTRDAVTQFHQLDHFRELRQSAGPRGRIEITAPGFPEAFSDWLGGFPPHTLLELAAELVALAQAPTPVRYAIEISPDTESGIDWFDVHVSLRAEDTTLTPEDLALLHRAQGGFVRLPGRGWRRIAIDDSAAAHEQLARLGIDPGTVARDSSREPLRFHALQLADDALSDLLPGKLWQKVRARSAALRADPAPPLPAGLVADLRPYQHDGFHFLAFLARNQFGGVLADDMGLGKTLQTLAWLLWLAEHAAANRAPAAPAARRRAAGKAPVAPAAGRPFRALIICPKSVVVNWQLETARFAPGFGTTAFSSALAASPAFTPAKRRRAAAPKARTPAEPESPAPHLVIANYAQLRLNAAALAAGNWDAVVLDEGQNIKNPASATARAARALRTTHRVVLTGTPVENRLLDLWSLFAFAQPGLLGGQAAFQRLYQDKTDPAGARARLAHRVRHFLLRRTKSQVARDLPARIEEELVVELEGGQRRLYDAELKRTRALLLGVKSSRDFDTQRFNILQSLLRLRQICCDPRLIQPPAGHPAASDAPAPDEPPPASGAKLEALLDTLEPLVAEGHKVLVFSQFVTMLELIRTELTARGISHLLLTGRTENRQALVDRFQTDPAIPVFLLSLKAAGSGLNLTAASYVVLFDPWWNPAVEAQAIDRTHRIGQKNQVIAYRLIARDTVEEKIRRLQREKAALAAAVVQEESLATVLDLDSLRRILS
jgi:hypothetical protein